MSKNVRVDQLLFSKGLAESRSQAQRLVMAGQVRIGDQIIPKPSILVSHNAKVEIISGPRFVSRGGEKLEAAFEDFDLNVEGLVCADVGASTGGFTDCLLQHNAAKVFSIDVGQGILHWKLRKHPQVVVMEGVNARYLDTLPEPVTFVTVDVSFISLKLIFPVIKNWFHGGGNDKENRISESVGEVVALIKPQFEAGRKIVAKGKGVVRDPEIHHQVLSKVLGFAFENDYFIRGLSRSPITGPKGNIEFLVWLQFPRNSVNNNLNSETLISQVIHPDN